MSTNGTTVLTRRAYRVDGLDCAEEVRALKATVGKLGGVDALSFDVLRARMVVTADPQRVPEPEIFEAVRRAGLKAAPWSNETTSRRGRTVGTVVSGVATAVGLGLELAGFSGMVAFGVGVVAGLWSVAPKALVSARSLRPDMNLLMTIAVAGAMAIGEWFEASTVSFLFSLSLALEAWSVGRARRAIEALMELAPAVARVVAPDGEREVAADAVETGTLIRVRPGERVPLDGQVEAGAGSVDESLLTGESMPVAKQVGDAVVAGSINGEGALDIRTSRRADESTVAHITRLVEEAGQRGSRVERWVEKFARIYTPIVMALALAVLLLSPFVAGVSWGDSIYRALVLLVIACPCALVISTPVGIVSGLTAAARQGVLIKEGTFLELPSRLRTVAFDKTGTLTCGKPRVVQMVALDGHTEDELLARAAAVEAGSEHPLAHSIIRAASERGLVAPNVAGVRAVVGKGAEGEFEGRAFWVGSRRWLVERGRETGEIRTRMDELSGPGRSVMLVGNERHVCGLIAVADDIRPESAQAVRDLHEAGVESAVMVTGDNEQTARAIAERIGIDDVRAELLPEDKISAITSLAREAGPVAMVGDGINDAPALAAADVGIAMAAAGSDTAIETADIALMTSDLSKLGWLVHHSRRVRAIVLQNIVAALAIKVIFVALTFGGFASLWAAIAADMGASLAVVFNALRLLRSP